ncbi:MAG: hypothetical protein J6Z41_02125 [Prevotella sp.]|nr:hypothetical protein [Prevotella sp.]
MKTFIRQIAILLFLLVAGNANADTYYGIKVAGVSVTDKNCDNVTGDKIKRNISGEEFYVKYVHSTKTLYIKNVKIERDGNYNRCILNESCDGLTVVFDGRCYFKAEDSSPLRFNANTTLNGINRPEGVACPVEVIGGDEDAVTVGSGATLTIDGVNMFLEAINSVPLIGYGKETVKVINNSYLVLVPRSGEKAAINKLACLRLESSRLLIQYQYLTSRPQATCMQNVSLFYMSDDMKIMNEGVSYSINKQAFVNGDGSEIKVLDLDIDYGVYINSTNFPDDNFRNYLMEMTQASDGFFSSRELMKFDYNRKDEAIHEISATNRDIYKLNGIEHFVQLKKLNLTKNHITNINTKPFPDLIYLNVSYNTLLSLDVQANKNLEEVNCAYNDNLYSFLFSHNSGLKTIACSHCALSSLDFSHIETLQYLNCDNNKRLTDDYIALNVTNCPNLQTLYCSSAQLSAVYMDSSNGLRTFHCQNNGIKTLDLTNKGFLKELWCQNNLITELKLPTVTGNKLEIINCSNNRLQTLTLSYSRNLTDLNCSGNQLASLNLSNNPSLTNIKCYNNAIFGDNALNLIKDLPELSNPTSSQGIISFTDHNNPNEKNRSNATCQNIAQKKGWCIYHRPEGNEMFFTVVTGCNFCGRLRGDVNSDGEVNTTDVTALYNVLFGTDTKTDRDICDIDLSGDDPNLPNTTDITFLYNIMFGTSR